MGLNIEDFLFLSLSFGLGERNSETENVESIFSVKLLPRGESLFIKLYGKFDSREV